MKFSVGRLAQNMKMLSRTGLMSLIIGLGLLIFALGPKLLGRDNRQAIADAELRRIAGALKLYQLGHGSTPTGSNAQIISALQSNGLDAASFPEQHLDKDGTYTDPWNTPFQIITTTGTITSLRSAGPNGILNDSDDIVWKDK